MVMRMDTFGTAKQQLYRCFALGLTALFWVVSGSKSFADEDKGLESAVLQLKWTHQFQFAGYYMAKELGFYEQEGIDLEIRPGSSTLDVTEEVLSGRADFGVGTSSLLLDYAAGKPVVVLGVIYQHSPLALIMRTEKPSDTIERVGQGRVMVESHAADLIAMMHRAGLSIKDLEITEYSDQSLKLLETTEDALSISAYQTDEPYTLLREGIPFNTFTPQTYGIDFYGDNFFTTQKTLNERSSLATAFRRASILGWQAALEHPEQAVALILEKYATRHDREKLLYEARITQDLMTNLVVPGHMNKQRWLHISETFREVGMLDDIPKLEGFIYSDEKRVLPMWFWPAFFSACGIIFLLTVLALYFRGLNIRLRREVTLRTEAEQELKISNRQLTSEKKISEEANLQKTWFITNVSHDLRAPVSSMISLTQIFNHHSESLKLPKKFNRFLNQLNSGGEFLMLMLDNILDYSAFEMNAANVYPQQVDLVQCCEGLVNITQSLADEKGVLIEHRCEVGEKFFELDRTRFSQILLNLLHNAIKFSPKEGTVFLDVTLLQEDLRVEVGDEGPGIPPERQKALFKMFGNSEKTTSRHASTGLGLSIVKRNVDLLGGSICVLQKENRGAVFEVVIPGVKPAGAIS